MRARAAMIWMNAAWREAVRARDAFVDVYHMLLGLVAAGGPAARLLAEHGLTLTAGRRAVVAERADALAGLGIGGVALAPGEPRPVGDLHRGAAGNAPLGQRAARLLKALPRGGGEREYLAALLGEPSGLVGRVLAWAGVAVDAVEGEVGSAPGWRTPTPRRVEALMSAGRGQHVSALRLEHYVPAPTGLVRAVASGPDLVPAWLTGHDDAPPVIDARRPEDAAADLGDGQVAVALTVDTATRVRFELRHGALVCGAYTLDLRESPGGTVVVFTRELVTGGHLGALVMPGVRAMTGLGMPTMVQNLSFACADAIEQDQR